MSGVIDNIIYCRKALDEVSQGVEILAVTKNHSAETANLAYEAGIRRIGENRVQELVSKLPLLNEGYTVELIGQLQTNKVRHIVDRVARVQSLDRMDLAKELDKRCKMANRVMPCLVEIRMDDKQTRAGVDISNAESFIRQAAKLDGIEIQGLMAVMPAVDDPQTVRPLMREMSELFVALREKAINNANMQCLSMGMSHDYIIAAQEGATLVRLGSAIFGARLTQI